MPDPDSARLVAEKKTFSEESYRGLVSDDEIIRPCTDLVTGIFQTSPLYPEPTDLINRSKKIVSLSDAQPTTPRSNRCILSNEDACLTGHAVE